MSYQDLNVKLSYISYGENNFVNSLLIPALSETKLYRRSVGFFSSSAIQVLMNGIISLAHNDGKIRLIASPKLSQEDIDAISAGYQNKHEILIKAADIDFGDMLAELADDELEALEKMISHGILDIRLAVTENYGMYHDKLGILDDHYGNSIVFYGSPNASKTAYCESNYEKVRVVKSWMPGSSEVVSDEIEEFDSLWYGINPFVKVYDYSTSAHKKIIEVSQKRKPAPAEEKGNKPIVLRDYQKEAIQAWVDNNYHGFYVMATGTGKTWTAIYSALRLLEEHNAAIFICAPYKHLVKQWADDVQKAIPDGRIILVSSENVGWEQKLTQAIVEQMLNPQKRLVVISTIVSFGLERFQRISKKIKLDKLLIVDEAHRFTNRDDKLNDEFKYMLGLSATPFSGKDTAKGTELMNFFGGEVFNLPIEKALKLGFLVKYYYYPIFVNATSYEEDQFRKKSSQIAGCFRNGKCIDPDNLVKYLRARLRIIAMAEEKIDRIQEILSYIKERDHFIVYCGDGRLYNQDEIRHINFVKEQLSSLGFKASQFTASENMETRMELVEAFNEGMIDTLAAIRCLDEGINIPSIKGALILASNDDYREFVQRRGRILRIYEDKESANIYDVVVLPTYETPKMAEIELRRYYEYARLAENSEAMLTQLDNIASDYGLELSDFATTFDDFQEGEIDE